MIGVLFGWSFSRWTDKLSSGLEKVFPLLLEQTLGQGAGLLDCVQANYFRARSECQWCSERLLSSWLSSRVRKH